MYLLREIVMLATFLFCLSSYDLVSGGDVCVRCLHESVAPAFPVLDGGDNVALVVLFAGAGLFIFCETAADSKALVGSEEASGIGPVEDHPPAECSHSHGRDSFDDETAG